MLTDNLSAPLILLVEDDEDQVELMRISLLDAEEEYRLETADTLHRARMLIEMLPPDLILTDYRLPDGDGGKLVLMANGYCPVVLMTSQGNEQLAVDAMKAGAMDYIVKTVEKLSGISRVVRRSLREWSLIQERKRAEEMLRLRQIDLEKQNEELRRTQEELEAVRTRYFNLYDLAPVGFLTFDGDGLILEANLAVATMLRVARSSLIMHPLNRFIFQNDLEPYQQMRVSAFASHEPLVREMRMLRADGSMFPVHLRANPAHNGEFWVSLIDISDNSKET